MAPGPGVSRVHRAKLQITGRNRSQNLRNSRVSSPRCSLGLSPSLWPIWRCLGAEALPGSSVQDRAWRGAAGEEGDELGVHLLRMQGGGGEGFPLDILHQKAESPFLSLKHKLCLPPAGCGPRNSPRPAEVCKPAAKPSGPAMLDPPWDAAALPVPALQISPAVAESLFIVLAEGFVSLLPSKFPGI